MTRLEAERIGAGLSKSKLARLADCNPAQITWAEQRGFRLYDKTLVRIAAALDFTGEPTELLDEVPVS